MRLCGEMNHTVNFVTFKQFLKFISIANIALFKNIIGVAFNGRQGVEISRIGQFVIVDNFCLTRFHQVQNKVSTDKTGSTCNKKCFHFCKNLSEGDKTRLAGNLGATQWSICG